MPRHDENPRALERGAGRPPTSPPRAQPRTSPSSRTDDDFDPPCFHPAPVPTLHDDRMSPPLRPPRPSLALPDPMNWRERVPFRSTRRTRLLIALGFCLAALATFSASDSASALEIMCIFAALNSEPLLSRGDDGSL